MYIPDEWYYKDDVSISKNSSHRDSMSLFEESVQQASLDNEKEEVNRKIYLFIHNNLDWVIHPNLSTDAHQKTTSLIEQLSSEEKNTLLREIQGKIEKILSQDRVTLEKNFERTLDILTKTDGIDIDFNLINNLLENHKYNQSEVKSLLQLAKKYLHHIEKFPLLKEIRDEHLELFIKEVAPFKTLTASEKFIEMSPKEKALRINIEELPLKNFFSDLNEAVDFAIKNKLEYVDFTGFSNLDDNTVIKLTENCKYINKLLIENCKITNVAAEAIANHLKDLTTLHLSECSEITDTGLASIAKIQSLTALNLSGCSKITDTGLASIANMHALNTLNLSWCSKITDTGLASITNMQTLKALDLSGCSEITDTGLASIANMQALTALNLRGCSKITDTGLASIANMQTLKALNLSWCSKITDTGLASIANMQALTALNLRGCSEITDTGLAFIANMQTLKALNLVLCSKITDTGLASIAKIQSLTALNLSWCSKITDTGLASIANMQTLKALDLRECSKITDTGLASIANMQALTALNLIRCNKITDTGLASIANMQALNALDLGECSEITDTGLASIANMQALTTLNLYRCRRITDTGLESIANMQALTALNLNGCFMITDTSLENLKSLKSLTVLNLSNCENITDAGKFSVVFAAMKEDLNIGKRLAQLFRVSIPPVYLNNIELLSKLNPEDVFPLINSIKKYNISEKEQIVRFIELYKRDWFAEFLSLNIPKSAVVQFIEKSDELLKICNEKTLNFPGDLPILATALLIIDSNPSIITFQQAIERAKKYSSGELKDFMSELNKFSRSNDLTINEYLFLPPVNSDKIKFYRFFDLLGPKTDTVASHIGKLKFPNISIISRLCERDPSFLTASITDVGDRWKQISELLQWTKDSAEWDELDGFDGIIIWDMKMNPSIPLTKKAVQRVLKLQKKNGVKKAHFRVALQTHHDFEEVMEQFSSEPPKPIIDRKTFEKIPNDKQMSYLRHCAVLRKREGLLLAGYHIHNRPDEALLREAIKVCIKVGVAPRVKTIEDLFSVLENTSYSLETKKLAAMAIGQIDLNPSDKKTIQHLTEIIKNTSPEDTELLSALINTLGNYNLSKDTFELLKTVYEKSTDPNLNRAIAFALSTLPDRNALQLAAKIVNGDDWDDFGSDWSERGITGGYELFTYRPSFHDNRKQMQKIIAERIVGLNRGEMESEAKQALSEYRKDLSKYPASLIEFSRSIMQIPDRARYIPYFLFLPKNRLLFRGINAKKGEKLAEEAFNDLFLSGAGSSDLSLYDTYLNGTWAKLGQIFSSTTLNYVARGFFDQNGVLMTIHSEEINEMQLRRSMRWQMEGSLHAVSYKTISHHQMHSLFMAKERVEGLQNLRSQESTKVKTSETKYKKIQRRKLASSEDDPDALIKRIKPFDPSQPLHLILNKIRESEGMKEATLEEIAEENLIRQYIREKLLETEEDPEIRKCLECSVYSIQATAEYLNLD